MIEIELTQGYKTTVDDADTDLRLLEWQVIVAPSNNKPYARHNVSLGDGKFSPLHLHRVILSRVLSRELKAQEDVDHIDMNTLNNTRENLRLATRSQNQANRGMNSNNKSGYKGVYWDSQRNKWRALICCKRKKYCLGRYNTPMDAHEAYKKKAIELFGEFARFE